MHHLLDANEMLGWVLLEIHNMHHMQRFMRAVRAAIDQGNFSEFARNFNSVHPVAEQPAVALSQLPGTTGA